jgi:hypothetical protein
VGRRGRRQRWRRLGGGLAANRGCGWEAALSRGGRSRGLGRSGGWLRGGRRGRGRGRRRRYSLVGSRRLAGGRGKSTVRGPPWSWRRGCWRRLGEAAVWPRGWRRQWQTREPPQALPARLGPSHQDDDQHSKHDRQEQTQRSLPGQDVAVSIRVPEHISTLQSGGRGGNGTSRDI